MIISDACLLQGDPLESCDHVHSGGLTPAGHAGPPCLNGGVCQSMDQGAVMPKYRQ